jgi:pre-mRNA-splicing factor CWC26
LSKFKTANESSWVTIDEGNRTDNSNDDEDRERKRNTNQSPLNKRKRIYSDDESVDSRSSSPTQRRKRIYSDDESSVSRSRSRSRSRSLGPHKKRKRVYSDEESSISRSRSRSRSRSKSRSRSRSNSSGSGSGSRRDKIPTRKHLNSDDEKNNNKKNNKVVRMSDGSLAGLQAGKDLKLDAKRKQKAQQEMLARMTSEESGKNAKTIYRDKYGKKVDLAVEKARLAEEERKKEAEAEKDMVWGKGLVQQKEREEMVRKLRQERDRSFAIYRDDKELNKEQMEKDRWGDPMAKLIKKKNSKNKTVRPRYNGPPPPPNRFNIEPGYRWDGVDRSNGFEEKYFQMKNQKESISEVAYKWSTEDM